MKHDLPPYSHVQMQSLDDLPFQPTHGYLFCEGMPKSTVEAAVALLGTCSAVLGFAAISRNAIGMKTIAAPFGFKPMVCGRATMAGTCH